MISRFDLSGRYALITGGGGMLGYQHAAAIAECGGMPVLVDIDDAGLSRNIKALRDEFGIDAISYCCDITNEYAVRTCEVELRNDLVKCGILINNAARNPKVEGEFGQRFDRLENFSEENWDADLAVGLKGAFICSKIFGSAMFEHHGKGVILNIASDLSVIAPDQRLYLCDKFEENMQPVKPVTYSVVKHGLIGLTKYLATYWPKGVIRCNALSPGGVENGQDQTFISRISNLIPMGRMAEREEYRGAVAFLCSDASSYVNGANVIVDGGRSVW